MREDVEESRKWESVENPECVERPIPKRSSPAVFQIISNDSYISGIPKPTLGIVASPIGNSIKVSLKKVWTSIRYNLFSILICDDQL